MIAQTNMGPKLTGARRSSLRRARGEVIAGQRLAVRGAAMRARGKVKGILVEGSDGHEYLLGFGSAEPTRSPSLSRRRADGTFEPLTDAAEASRVAVAQLGLTGPFLIGPGMGRDLFLWGAFQEALKTFPPVPPWPTWSA